MILRSIGNGVGVSELDLNNDGECRELGKLAADECVVVLDQATTESRLYDIHGLWGQPFQSLVPRFISDGTLRGRHWRNVIVNLGRTSRGSNQKRGMARVSTVKDKRGKPTGLFPNGELKWHADQPTVQDSQLLVSLMSLGGTEGSQTSLLCTAPAYDTLDHNDRTTVEQLVSVRVWDGGSLTRGLDEEQLDIVEAMAFPMPELETPLLNATATGRTGLRFPAHDFSHFKGMSREESLRYRAHLWERLNQPEHVYTHDWQDGQILIMDQSITLHARPTDIQDGDTRTLCRIVSYVDRLFPEHAPYDHIDYQGQRYSLDAFATLADDHRRKTFEAAQASR